MSKNKIKIKIKNCYQSEDIAKFICYVVVKSTNYGAVTKTELLNIRKADFVQMPKLIIQLKVLNSK